MFHHNNSLLNNFIIQLPNNVILSPVDSARNLGVIFDNNLSSEQVRTTHFSCFDIVLHNSLFMISDVITLSQVRQLPIARGASTTRWIIFQSLY